MRDPCGRRYGRSPPARAVAGWTRHHREWRPVAWERSVARTIRSAVAAA